MDATRTDQAIRLWDATTGVHIMCITNRTGGIYDLAYSPDKPYPGIGPR